MRKMAAELEQQRAELDEVRQQVKARPVPPTTAPGLYTKQVAEMEERSRERRAVRRTVPQPFSFHNRPASARRSWDKEKEGDESVVSTPRDAYLDVSERRPFKAREVPRSMSEPRWEMMRVRDAERREKVAQEALKLAQRSRLPPRMAQHKETARAKKAAEAERIQAELDQELTLKPRITEGIPDFDRLHLSFEQAQARKRSSYKPTVPTPFRMESEPYKQMASETRKVKEEMIRRDMRRDELVMPERRWPYLSTQAPVSRTNPPDSGLNRSNVPHFETTELVKARIAKREEEARQRVKESEERRKQDEQREAEQKRATRAVASRLREIAGDPRHLKRATQEKEEEEKRRIRKENREQRQQAKEWIAKINEKVAARPFLFEQARCEADAEPAPPHPLVLSPSTVTCRTHPHLHTHPPYRPSPRQASTSQWSAQSRRRTTSLTQRFASRASPICSIPRVRRLHRQHANGSTSGMRCTALCIVPPSDQPWMCMPSAL